MNMGERIKQLRIANGLTQEELGKYIGVQKAAIRKYEKGEVKTWKDLLFRFYLIYLKFRLLI